MIRQSQWLGRAIALGVVVGAVVVVTLALLHLDARPRTHDGFLFADTAGLAPQGGRPVAKPPPREDPSGRKDEALGANHPPPFQTRSRQGCSPAPSPRRPSGITPRLIPS